MITLPIEQPIFVVDDDKFDHLILSRVLRFSHLQNEVEFFEDGASVLAHMEEVARGRQTMPALILLDVNLPCLAGFEVLTQLRAMSEFGTLPVIVMLTSSEASEDRAQAIGLGANDLLTKQSGFKEYVTLFNQRFVNES